MDQVWTRQVVLDTLTRRQMAGEGPLDTMGLQTAAGLGPLDASGAADLLVEEGIVARESGSTGPQWRLKSEEELERVARETLVEEDPLGYDPSRADFEPEPPAAFPSDESDRAERARATELASAAVEHFGVSRGLVREVVLTATMMQAMSADTVGSLILAGVIEAADAGAEFRLVVKP